MHERIRNCSQNALPGVGSRVGFIVGFIVGSMVGSYVGVRLGYSKSTTVLVV